MGPEINKVGQTQTSEIKQDDNQSARILNRSNSNVIIGKQREQGTVSSTTPTVSEIMTETENSFSKAKTLPEHELSHRLEESFGSQDNNENIIPLAPELPPLNAKVSQLRNNENQGSLSFGDELKQTVKNNKREYNGSSLEEMDKSVNEKKMESTKSLFKEEKIISQDKEILSETQYQDKPVHENIKDISNQDIQLFVKEFKSGEKGLSSLVGEIDKTLNKDKVYIKAREMGKEITSGLDPEMTLGIKLRSDTELKEIVANSVAIKDKYHESHDKALSKYTKGMAQLGPLMVRYEELRVKTRPTPEERALKQELSKQMYDIGKKYDLLTTYPANKGGGILIGDIKSPPSLYQALPSNKQKLVNSIVEGMKSGIPDQASKEKVKFGGEVGLENEIEIPESIMLNNKTYINPQYLAKGGLGAVFKYVNQDDPNDTVVVKNLLDPTKKDEMVTEIKNHIHAVDGQENNPNVINLKGIVKGNGTELYMVMETAKCDAKNVFNKFDEISSQNLISPQTHDLLKTFLSRDMLESMLYLQKDRNMIHLDLKRDNFLMNNEGKAVIADFGTSRRTQEGFNLKFDNDNPMASPEALSRTLKDNDEKLLITEKSDIWSLGITLNTINYGETRLNVGSMTGTSRNVIEFSKNDNNRLIENEAFGVDRVINAMTHPDPNQRPTLEAVLKTSLFTEPKLDKPELRELVKELLSVNPDPERIRILGQAIES